MKTVYRFTASWCQPCKSLAALLDRESIKIHNVMDVDSVEAKPLVTKYGIRSVPTIVIDSGSDFISITGATLSNHHKALLKDALA